MRLKWCHQPAAGRILCVICNKLSSTGNWFKYSLNVYNYSLGYNVSELNEHR